MTVRIHETALIEDDVEIGAGTAIWDGVHIRHGSRIGRNCIVGEKSYLGPGVIVGDLTKINAHVYLPTGVRLGRGVMVAAGAIFTNDRYPRAADGDLGGLLTSDVTDETLPTVVEDGVTIGAGAVIGCGFEIGRFAVVGMGSVVTRAVEPFSLVIGNPARSAGWVCRCGTPIARISGGTPSDTEDLTCGHCGRRYAIRDGVVIEASGTRS